MTQFSHSCSLFQSFHLTLSLSLQLRRLMERLLDGVEGTLQELRLGHNKLGDQLNPIFSTNEFLHLKALRVLDLSHNELRALDNNIFRGLRNLTVSVNCIFVHISQ